MTQNLATGVLGVNRISMGNISNLAETSDYQVAYKGDDGARRRGLVFQHRRSDGALPLIAKAIAALGPSA